MTDIVMPRVEGRELVARARARDPGLRVVFMTGQPDEASALARDELVLHKPFTPELLARALRTALDGAGD
ncbi:MAG: hypothetical protein H6713_25210 [Myxococcales bacterium]|nr:hypothetical protein [Myxococcales bacterium]